MKRYLITGCPRSGTGYISKLLTVNGLPCTHEARNGKSKRDASWLRAADRGVDIIKLHQVRNPSRTRT